MHTEKNVAADYLVKLGLNSVLGFHERLEPPDGLLTNLGDDWAGISRPRLIVVWFFFSVFGFWPHVTQTKKEKEKVKDIKFFSKGIPYTSTCTLIELSDCM